MRLKEVWTAHINMIKLLSFLPYNYEFIYVSVLEPDVTPTGVCQMKNDRGTCTDYVVKWFYNTTAGRCDRFWYGGCDGNDNRFDDQEACSRRCSQTGPDTGMYFF